MKFYDVKISLTGVTPLVWRRLLVPEDLSLFQMHRVSQATMGWTDSHLHRFLIERRAYSLPEFELGGDVSDERQVQLSSLAETGRKAFVYEYDFGDGWQHRVEIGNVRRKIVAVLRSESPNSFRSPDHPDHKSAVRRLGKRFNPSAFDLEAVERSLSRLRLRRTRGAG